MLDDASHFISVCAPISVTPGILNITLALGFHLKHRNDLGTCLHQFCLGQHASAARKVLKARADQHQFIAGGSAAPLLEDTNMLTALDGVSFTSTMDMAREAHTQLRMVLVTLLGQDHPTALAMRDINTDILQRGAELEEYNPWDRGLKARLPDLITLWVHIWLSE